MFSKLLARTGHTREYTVTRVEGGWEIRQTEDHRIVRLIRSHDWHRVERALSLIRLQVRSLEADGWVAQG